MDGMMVGQPIAAFGLGTGAGAVVAPVSPSSPSGAPAMGAAFLPGVGKAGFTRSAEFGLLLGLALVVYIDGRVLPRKR